MYGYFLSPPTNVNLIRITHAVAIFFVFIVVVIGEPAGSIGLKGRKGISEKRRELMRDETWQETKLYNPVHCG